MYKLDLSKKVIKVLAKNELLTKKFYHHVKILLLNPFSNKLDIKKLQGETNRYRLRIGKYRFLYEIYEEKVIIYFYDAGSRGNIY